ncbi:DUF6597 domain-containing transcriptional factor [Aliikangiella sp. IMCC44359]|uniref:DUF6597 domain-containing transcriptional factor n=1 Tax=Aliikangiella sp. IMCC44359 TaxID=3459125 RepID=UPI00403B374C
MPIDFDYTTFQGGVLFRDAYWTHPPTHPLSYWIQNFWQLNVPIGHYNYRSIPDNCVDWIINVDTPEDSYIIPPFLSSIVFELTGPTAYFGVRFRLLGHQSIIEDPLGVWAESSDNIKASDIIPHVLFEKVQACIIRTTEFKARCRLVSQVLLDEIKEVFLDKRLVNYILYCQNNISSHIDLSNKQCAEFGLSSRQLRRLSQLYLGLSPREFARVLRFQQILKQMNLYPAQTNWSDYYYDQSHFIKEFKLLSGLTPKELVNLSVLYNKK